MAGAVTDPLAPQCGNCKFWDRIPNHPAGSVGECLGLPPTPCIVGAQPARIGNGVQYATEMMRPMMASAARPCSLHVRLPAFELGKVRQVGETSEIPQK